MRPTNTTTMPGASRTLNLLGSAALGVLALAMPQLANAQAADADAAVEAVVVTGSRLATAGFQAPTPVTVLGAAQLEARAATTVFDLTKDVPVFRSSGGLNNAMFGMRVAGQALLDLRGLGNVRTLILVDGLRPNPVNSTGVFDTNLLPASLIERTEIVTGGASAAYVSDAVAGVVNFILKKRIDGFTGTVQTGRSMHGDNVENLVSLAWGTTFLDDKARFIIGGDYNENQGVLSTYDRAWGRREPAVFALPATRAAGLPSQIFTDYAERSNNTAGGFILSGPLKNTAFDVNGNPYQFQFGPIVGTSMMYSPNQTNYLNTNNGYQMIKGPYERYATMARLEYEVSPNLTAYGTVNVGELRTHVRIFGWSPADIIIRQDNPYIPASIRAAMVAQNLPTFTMAKLGSGPTSEFPGWNSGNVLRNINWTVGLQGTILDGWRWDAGYQRGHSDFNRAFLDTQKTANYYASLFVIPGPNGTPICGPVAQNPMFLARDANTRAIWTANLEPGCVPYNPFGTKNASPEALAYVHGDSRADEDVDQQSAQVNLSGEPFALPAGPVSLAVGAEWRKIDFESVAAYGGRPLYLVNENNVSFDASITVKEAYAEVGVPILKDLPFIKQLDGNAAVRRTDYSTSGGVTTWKVGGTWEVNDTVRFRATRSRDIRAPNINELFLKGQSGASILINKVTGQQALTSGESSGNPNLQPEIADTFTAGVVLQPTWEWAWASRLAVDYYSIDVKDIIGSIANQEVLDRYYLLGLTEYASFITFCTSSPTGFCYMKNAPLNLNRQKTNGVDIELSMRPPIDAIGIPGRLDFRGLATWVDDLRTISPRPGGLPPEDQDTAGQFVPDWTMNFNFTYTLEKFSTNLNVKYTTNVKYSQILKGPDDPDYNPAANNSINKNRFPSSTLWNLSSTYDLIQEEGRRLQLFGVVENLFDKDPPLVGLYIVPGGNPYDLVGRNFKAGVRFSF